LHFAVNKHILDRVTLKGEFSLSIAHILPFRGAITIRPGSLMAGARLLFSGKNIFFETGLGMRVKSPDLFLR
jgi:hypothetical protein